MNISRNVVFFTINLENQGEDSYLFRKNNCEMKLISLGGGGGRSLGQQFFLWWWEAWLSSDMHTHIECSKLLRNFIIALVCSGMW